ncbi:MAG: Gldg family protein [Sandaracinus sp.]|nr:Gldg family protein [Sandaracinus sp.]MCB9619920.1 Gldg family protein [Sandaracinus sp.]
MTPALATALGLAFVVLGELVLHASWPTYLGVGLCAVGATTRLARHRDALSFAHLGLLAALGLHGLSTERGLDLLGLAPGHLGERILGLAAPAALLLAGLATAFGERVAFVLRSVDAHDASVNARVRDAIYRGLSLGLALVFVVSLDVAARARDVRVDLSFLRVTEPSETSQRLVRALDGDVRAVLFYPEGHEVAARVRPYFDTLADASSHLKVERLDHALAPELAERLHVTSNGFLVLFEGEGEAIRSESVELGLDLASARPRLRTLDGRFQEAFARLTQPRREIALTVGHGERSHGGAEVDPAERLDRFVVALRRANIQVTTLGLAQGLAQEVPRGTPLVAVLGARDPFAPEEVETLLRFVHGGGRLLVLVDHEAEGGADALLAGLGLRLRPGVLASETSVVARDRDLSDRARVFASRFSDHPVVISARADAGRSAVVLHRGAALEEAPTEGVEVVFPVRTEENVWRDLDGDLTRDDDEPLETQRMLAAVTVRAPRASRVGRAVVIADGSFAGDDLLGYRGNFRVLGDALGWLLGDLGDDRPAIVGATTSEEDVPVEHAPEDERLWLWLGSLGVPLPLGIAGVVVALRRRRRRREGDA